MTVSIFFQDNHKMNHELKTWQQLQANLLLRKESNLGEIFKTFKILINSIYKNFWQYDTNSTCETFIIKRFVADSVAGKINKNKNDFILAMTLFSFLQLLPTKVIIGYSHV